MHKLSKLTEFFTLSGYSLWYINCTSTKPLKKNPTFGFEPGANEEQKEHIHVISKMRQNFKFKIF